MFEAALLPKKILMKEIKYTLYTVSVRNFVITFYFGSGSGILCWALADWTNQKEF
jgi:hypothetical protein